MSNHLIILPGGRQMFCRFGTVFGGFGWYCFCHNRVDLARVSLHRGMSVINELTCLGISVKHFKKKKKIPVKWEQATSTYVAFLVFCWTFLKSFWQLILGRHTVSSGMISSGYFVENEIVEREEALDDVTENIKDVKWKLE